MRVLVKIFGHDRSLWMGMSSGTLQTEKDLAEFLDELRDNCMETMAARAPDKEAMGGMIRQTPVDGIDEIIALVATLTHVTEERMRSRERTGQVAFARQLAMYLARRVRHPAGRRRRCRCGCLMHSKLTMKMTLWSYPEIGGFFNRDHSTAMHACRMIEQRMQEPAFAAFVDNLLHRAVAA